MSTRKRGRITVQSQPTGAARGIRRMIGAVHAVIGFVFVVISITVIIPGAGLFGVIFLVAGAFFCINGVRMVISKNDIPHRVGYEVETDLDRSIVGLMEDVAEEGSESSGSVQDRLTELRALYEQRLITQEEYDAKRQEILKEL